MGRPGEAQNRSRTLIAAAFALAFAWPAAALAQDAIDIDSSFTTFTPGSAPLPDVIVADRERRFEPLANLATGVPNELHCDNETNQDTVAGLRDLRRTVSSATGNIGATYTSNAQEADGGEDDLLTTTTIRLERVRRSYHGLCRPSGPGTAFDPRTAYTLYANSLNLAFREDNGTDASRFTIGGAVSWAVDDGSYFKTAPFVRAARYRTRVSASLDNNVTYRGLYQDWISTSHDARVGFSHIVRGYADAQGAVVGTLTVRGAVGRVFSNPETSSYNVATVSLTRDWQLNPQWGVAVTGSATYNQFTDAEPVDFDDTRYRLGLTVTYTFAPDIAVEATANVDARTSDIPLREFEAISLPLSLRFVRRF